MTSPLSFEDALARLEEIVRLLDNPKTNLEDALTFYEEGSQLLKNCQTQLDTAQRKIEILQGQDETGEPIMKMADENDFKTTAPR